MAKTNEAVFWAGKEKYMSYEEFKEYIIAKLADFYGRDACVSAESIVKNNDDEEQGICIRFAGEKNQQVPLIEIEELYCQYVENRMDIDDCIGEVIDMRERYNDTPSQICR